MRLSVKEALHGLREGGEAATVCGWVRTSRFSKRVSFIHLYDGPGEQTLQVVVSPPLEVPSNYGVGVALRVTGVLAKSPGRGQSVELQALPEDIEVLGACDAALYPVQKKEASPEYWRTIPHLRVRTSEYQRIFQARSLLSHGIHCFFQDRGFSWVHTPIITFSDCEGAGEMFHVATKAPGGLDAERLHDDSFFGRPASLTVSGQLEGEALALALGKIYTFGPTFRAEYSHTSRHASEFWMIEPEIAFADLYEVIQLAEDLLKSLLCLAVTRGVTEGELPSWASGDPFPRIRYSVALEILQEAISGGRVFEYPVGWEHGLQSEHERYLCEEHFKSPVVVTHYPADLKSFYMRRTRALDGSLPPLMEATVECFDLLVPGVGEIIGGSAREEDLALLEDAMRRRLINLEEYSWYLDLRRFGSAPHGGFGLGLERLLMWVLDVKNIRDVLPFPRTPA